jgi:acetoin utilization protein AcuC
MSITVPVLGKEEQVTLFHEKEYVDFVKASSKRGEGFLDYGDTPSFKGVYEASLYTVGSSLDGLNLIMEGKVDHFFNPIGGLHHARRDRAGGFCVFNDSACAIEKALIDYKLKTIAYVDIDAHHGDGVYYGFESNKHVIIGDVHEDGRFLYPGTGQVGETGEGDAKGTKMNSPLRPGSSDAEFIEAFDRIVKFIKEFNPEFIFFQCGADGLANDPLTHLQYSPKAHAFATQKLHDLAHEVCNGRLLAMGGGGYNPNNVEAAWMAVTEALIGS